MTSDTTAYRISFRGSQLYAAGKGSSFSFLKGHAVFYIVDAQLARVKLSNTLVFDLHRIPIANGSLLCPIVETARFSGRGITIFQSRPHSAKKSTL